MHENTTKPSNIAQSAFITALIGRDVVLDTAGAITFLGRLEKLEETAFVLTNADIRDSREGHVSKDKYICEALTHGIQSNRRRLLVMADAIISVSALDDVVGE